MDLLEQAIVNSSNTTAAISDLKERIRSSIVTYSRLGSKVVHFTLLAGTVPEVTNEVVRWLSEEGFSVLLAVKVEEHRGVTIESPLLKITWGN